MPVEAAVEGASLVVVVDGAALGVVNPEVIVGMVGGVLGMVDAGERQGCKGDDLGLIDDRGRGVRKSFEVGGNVDSVGLGEGRDGEGERKKDAENSHGDPCGESEQVR